MKGRRVRFVTVVGPEGAVDTVLAADASLSRVIELVVGEVGGNALPVESARWALFDEAGRVLPATSTLVREGVVDGDLLRVSHAGSPA